MTTLDFCDYLNICNRLFSFCDYVRRRAPYADSVLLKDSQKWENELLPGYNNPKKLQLSCREYLKGKNVDEVAEYRQGILIEGTITALVDDLRSGAVSCPDNIKGWLILSLKGLVTLCSHLSQMCFAEFDKMKPKKEERSLIEMISTNNKAFRFAEFLKSNGCLDDEYKPSKKHKKIEWCIMGYHLSVILNCTHKPIEDYWGLKNGRIRKDVNSAQNTKYITRPIERIIEKFDKGE